jgi:hypothetical protein
MKKTPLIVYIALGLLGFFVCGFILWLISLPFTNPWYWKIWFYIFNIENEIFLLFAFLHLLIVGIVGSIVLPEKIKKCYPFFNL